jgi:DNA-binding transcriptional LysR family regulator
MTDRLLALRAFVRAARSGSFSRAARELGLSQPSVSRILAGLEMEVGAGLLMRTTRRVTLTEAGADYLARVEPLLAGLEEADHAARGTGALRGLLRVALSSSFGVREVIPRLPAFLEAHPGLKMDLRVADAKQDLIADGIDVALRLGLLPDSALTSRKIGEAPRLLVASPAYLARRGRPAHPDDLGAHALIIGPGGANPLAWTFTKERDRVSIRPDARLSVGANEAAVAAASAGIGVAMTSLWACRAELARGDLERLLTDWRTDPVEAHAIFPVGRAASPAARAFIDYLAPKLRAGEADDRD